MLAENQWTGAASWNSGGSPLRPAVEDLIGAEAVIAGLASDSCSPEAKAAVATFDAANPVLLESMRSTASGRELILRGFEDDVRISAEHDCSLTVPTLDNGAFDDRTKEDPTGQ